MSRITLVSVISNPIRDYILNLSPKRKNKTFNNLVSYLLFGFTGIPLIVRGDLKKGLIVLMCLLAGAGSFFVKDIHILRQVLFLVWLINYLKAFWELLKDTGKKRIYRLYIIVLSLIPIELAVIYLFRLG